MTGVLKLVTAPTDKTQALEVIESLRQAVETGQIKAFAAVGIEPDHATRMWQASTLKTTKLEMLGAIARLEHCYHVDVGED